MIGTSRRKAPYNLEAVWGKLKNPECNSQLSCSLFKNAGQARAYGSYIYLNNNLVEEFQKEKITPVIVSLWSVREINRLGINNGGDLIKHAPSTANENHQRNDYDLELQLSTSSSQYSRIT